MRKQDNLKKLTKLLVNSIFYFGVAVTVTIPFWTRYFYEFVKLETRYYPFMTVVLFIFGACAIYILYNLMSIYKTLDNNPFVEKNIKYLLNMGKACFIIFFVAVVKIFFVPTLATVIIIAVFGMAGLFCLTIKDLFSKAVSYKQDNDMTI